MSKLAAALAYAERLGAAVIPTGRDCKPGAIRKWWPVAEGEKDHFASHDGTKDPAMIREIWKRNPAANVSLVTGAISGFFVLDIDAKDGKVDGFGALAALEAANGSLPRSWRAATPSGGEHRYFRQPAGAKLRNKVGLRTYDQRARVLETYQGLDIRTDGGAIAAAPSAKPNGTYRWLDKPLDAPLADAPAWLIRLAMDAPMPPKADRAPLRRESADRMARYVERALDNECGRVAGTKAGRNLQLFKSAANLGQLVGANLLPQDIAENDLFNAAGDCGLVGEDGAHSVRATIRSGLAKGILNPREVRP
jgi:hypothetical protein